MLSINLDKNMNNIEHSPINNGSLRKKTVGAALSLIIGGSGVLGGIFGPSDGDEMLIKNQTDCYQCPGGEKLTRFGKLNCVNGQTDWGQIAEGDKVKVETGKYDFFPNDGGYTRVEAENIFSYNPFTNEKIDLGERTCWVKTGDLEKPKK